VSTVAHENGDKRKGVPQFSRLNPQEKHTNLQEKHAIICKITYKYSLSPA